MWWVRISGLRLSTVVVHPHTCREQSAVSVPLSAFVVKHCLYLVFFLSFLRDRSCARVPTSAVCARCARAASWPRSGTTAFWLVFAFASV